MTTLNTAWRHKLTPVEIYDGTTAEQLRALADYLELFPDHELESVEVKSGFPEDMTYLHAVVETGMDYS